MKLPHDDFDGVRVLRPHGTLVGSPETSELFGETVRKALDTGVRNIVVDLGHTPWINSSGIGTIIVNYSHVRRAGGRLVLCRLPSRVETVLHTVGLSGAIDWYSTEEEALDSFRDMAGSMPPPSA